MDQLKELIWNTHLNLKKKSIIKQKDWETKETQGNARKRWIEKKWTDPLNMEESQNSRQRHGKKSQRQRWVAVMWNTVKAIHFLATSITSRQKQESQIPIYQNSKFDYFMFTKNRFLYCNCLNFMQNFWKC